MGIGRCGLVASAPADGSLMTIVLVLLRVAAPPCSAALFAISGSAGDTEAQVEGTSSAPSYVTFRLRCRARCGDLGHPQKLASTMTDASFSVVNDGGSAAGHRGSGLRLVIDQPMPGVRVVQVAGELDLLTMPQLDSRLLSQINGCGGHVVVDLSEVTFLGAAGLGGLVKAREAATRHGVELYLIGVDHRAVALPLEITGLRTMFAIHSSTHSVIATVAGKGQMIGDPGAGLAGA